MHSLPIPLQISMTFFLVFLSIQGSNAHNVRVPGLSSNSVYHDSARLDMSSVEMDRVGGVSLKTRPFEPVKSVNASTRPKILHLLFHVYNNHIMDISKSLGLESFMKVILKVLGRGHVQVGLMHAKQSVQIE